jgi:clan AA aspartic protease (TIGR02281 family)
MVGRGWVLAALIAPIAWAAVASAGYLDENPEEVFAEVYARLGSLPLRAARDPYVWLRLSELKREPCDQTTVLDFAGALEKLGYRREAADALYNFVRHCGAPNSALHRSVEIFLRLSDYPKAVEVADEYVRRAPTLDDARYMRGTALEGVQDFRRALVDYADAIELFSGDKRSISSRLFLSMARAYAALGQFCEATTPIYTYVALDPAARDTSQTQKIIADYQQRGNCAAAKEAHRERYPLRGSRDVVTVKAKVNGVSGTFILDTGAGYVAVRSDFAERAKVPLTQAGEITLSTANGPTRGMLTKADKVALGSLEASQVPVVVQKGDAKLYGRNIDGLLGMSFLSRFELQLAGGFMEIRTRRPK